MTMDNYYFDQFLIPFMVRLFFVVGIVGIAIGVGLIAASARMQAMFSALNRWVSARESTKWLSVPRDSGLVVQRYRVWVGLVFALGGAVMVYILFDQLGGAQMEGVMAQTYPHPITPWVFESVKWVLILGCILAVVVGIMMLFFPGSLAMIETRSDRWISTRRWGLDGDTMHMALDHWVEKSPKLAGTLILLGSAFVTVTSGILVFTKL
jgi:hypothetical protein